MEYTKFAICILYLNVVLFLERILVGALHQLVEWLSSIEEAQGRLSASHALDVVVLRLPFQRPRDTGRMIRSSRCFSVK